MTHDERMVVWLGYPITFIWSAILAYIACLPSDVPLF